MGTCGWSRGSIVGRGSSAAVSVATDHRSGKIFAVKSAELALSELLQFEQRVLSQLECPRVVGYVGHDVTVENGRRFYNLLMEYADGGTLTDVIHRQEGGRLEESAIKWFTREILQGLAYLHSKKLAHCDIKGRNVLVGADGVKVADFGCAKWVDEASATIPARIAGTPLYMAPEVARGEEQGLPADVWALGCTVIEMATGCLPWPDVTDPIAALYRIGHSLHVPESPSWVSEEAKDFLSKCLRRCPQERWTVHELLKHPFVASEPGSRLKQVIDTPIATSPKSILDYGIWDSFAKDQTHEDVTPHIDFSNNSPARRIQQLTSGSSSSPMPDWTCEGNWVTVRISGDVENSPELVGQILVVEEMGVSDSVRGSDEGLEVCTSSLIEEGAVSSGSSSGSMNDKCADERTSISILSFIKHWRGFDISCKRRPDSDEAADPCELEIEDAYQHR